MTARAPNVSTAGWRLPTKNKAGAKRAGRFDRQAYAKLGLDQVVEGTKDAPPPKPGAEPETKAPTSGGGLPSIDTSQWTLSEAKKKQKRPSSELGKRWDADPPKDKKGREVLFGGDDDEEQETTTRTALRMAGKVEMRGMSMDRIKELRQLAGLVESGEREFALGTPHRRMPGSDRAVPVMESRITGFKPGDIWEVPGRSWYFAPLEVLKNGNYKGLMIDLTGRRPKKARKKSVQKRDVKDGFWKKMDKSDSGYREILGYFKGHSDFPKHESAVPQEQSRLMETRQSLPSGGFQPQRATPSGMLDPVTEGEAHGEDFIDRVLSESRWFFHDYGKLGPGQTEAPKRDDWEGSDPEYSDREMDLDDEEDDEEDDDEQNESRGRRVKYRHVGPGGTGRAKRQHRQSREQHLKNISRTSRRGKKEYERSAKGRHTRKMSKLRRKMHQHAGVEEGLEDRAQELLDLSEKRKIGGALKRLGRKMGRGTKSSRKIVDKAKSKLGKWKDDEHEKFKKRKVQKKKRSVLKKQKKRYGHRR